MNVLRSLAIGAAALLSVTAAHAQTHTMKISSPTVNDLSQEWAKEFKAGIEARSGGKIKVEFYPANQLGQIPATVEGTAMGTIEAVVPGLGLLHRSRAALPGVRCAGPVQGHGACPARVRRSGGAQAARDAWQAARASSRSRSWRMARLLLLSHKPIRAVADFKGQKIRVPGAAPLQIEPFKKLGAAPVSMPLGEVLSAMQNRTIDGLIASATVFTAFKYYDVAKGLTALPGSFLIAPVMANKNFMKSLGPELEAMVREEAFKAQQKVEKFGIEDVGRTADVWKKNGGENITLTDGESKAYLDQVKSVLPGCSAPMRRSKPTSTSLSARPQSVRTEAPSTLLRSIDKTMDALVTWIERVLAVGLLIGISLNFVNVVGRYLGGLRPERRRRGRDLHSDLDRLSRRRARHLARRASAHGRARRAPVRPPCDGRCELFEMLVMLDGRGVRGLAVVQICRSACTRSVRSATSPISRPGSRTARLRSASGHRD